MKATSKAGYGSGWHNQSLRHSNAKKHGHAGGKYSSVLPEYDLSKSSLYRFANRSDEHMPSTQLSQGKQVEKEHKSTLEYFKKHPTTPLSKIEEKIAKDHIKESNTYYTDLKKVENNKPFPIPTKSLSDEELKYRIKILQKGLQNKAGTESIRKYKKELNARKWKKEYIPAGHGSRYQLSNDKARIDISSNKEQGYAGSNMVNIYPKNPQKPYIKHLPMSVQK